MLVLNILGSFLHDFHFCPLFGGFMLSLYQYEVPKLRIHFSMLATHPSTLYMLGECPTIVLHP